MENIYVQFDDMVYKQIVRIVNTFAENDQFPCVFQLHVSSKRIVWSMFYDYLRNNIFNSIAEINAVKLLKYMLTNPYLLTI